MSSIPFLYVYDEDAPFHIDMSGFDYSRYCDGEENIIQPQLEALGYAVGRWRMGEADSFGPLSRKVLITKDDQQYWFWYG